MSRAVYKYPIKTLYHQVLDLPADPKIALVDSQVISFQETPCLWFEIDTDAPIKGYDIFLYGTGQSIIEKQVVHLGSYQQPPYVWHVYMREHQDS